MAGSEDLKQDPRLYSSFRLLGETLRDNGYVEIFSEILIVAQK